MPRWVAEPNQWSLVNRREPWEGDTGGLGESLPPNCTVMASTGGRKFRVWAYCPENELYLEVPFSDVRIEGGLSSLPTGKIDVNGPPVVSWHGGMVKLFGKLWGGDGGHPGALYRVYTFIRYT